MIHRTADVETIHLGVGNNIWQYAHIRNNVMIGDHNNIGRGVYIDIDVKIGHGCKIQNYACIYSNTIIGNDVFIGPHVVITNDKYPDARNRDFKAKCFTVIHDGASIGANSTVISGVTIGKNAMIGAGSVVTKDVPENGMWMNASMTCSVKRTDAEDSIEKLWKRKRLQC
jgi:acetyltransferase-like isoleucine patch superfamily enzyme